MTPCRVRRWPTILKNAIGVKKVCLVDDSTDAGVGQIQAIAQTLGPLVDSACTISIKKGDKDFSAAVTQIQGQSPDAVVFASYYTGAHCCCSKLREAGYTGLFAGPDGLEDPQFVRAAEMPRMPSCRARAGRRPATSSTPNEGGWAGPGTYSVGLRRRHDPAQGIDPGGHPAGVVGLRQELQRTRPGAGIPLTDTGELTSNLIWIYKVQ